MNTHRVEAAAASSAAFQMPEGFLVLSELSAAERSAGLHTLVLAYAAADKANSNERARPGWLSTLDGTLAKVGWTAFSGSGAEFESTEISDVMTGVSRGLPSVLQQVARLAVESALEELASKNEDVSESPPQVFHFCSVWREAATLRLSVARILAESRVDEKPGAQGSKVVSRIHHRWRTLGMVLNGDVYAQVEDAVASKVEPVLSRYAIPAELPSAASAPIEAGKVN